MKSYTDAENTSGPFADVAAKRRAHPLPAGLASSVGVTDTAITVELTDGRFVVLPPTRRLREGTPAQRANVLLFDYGALLNWPDLDEDIGVWSFLGRTEEEIATFADTQR